MKLVLISDTHRPLPDLKIPDGDVLIHAGDHTFRGDWTETAHAMRWLSNLPHAHKLILPGNHDWMFHHDLPAMRQFVNETGMTLLIDESVTIDDIEFYGSPWQPEFHNWAFNLPRNGEELAAKWAAIPETTQVLITHGPPFGILDRVPSGLSVGCELLAERVKKLPFLQLHVFGHIHHGYGRSFTGGYDSINASTCDEDYRPRNAPVEFVI